MNQPCLKSNFIVRNAKVVKISNFPTLYWC